MMKHKGWIYSNARGGKVSATVYPGVGAIYARGDALKIGGKRISKLSRSNTTRSSR